MLTFVHPLLRVNTCVQVGYRWDCRFRRQALRSQRFWAKPVCLGWSAWFSGVAGLTYAVWRLSIDDGQPLIFESNATGSTPVSPGAIGSWERSTGLTSSGHGNLRVAASWASRLMRASPPLHWIKLAPRKGRCGTLCQWQPIQLRSPLLERGGVGMSFSILTSNRQLGIRYPCTGSFHRIGSAKEFASPTVCCRTDYVGTLWSLPSVPASPANTPIARQVPGKGTRYMCGWSLDETGLEARAGLPDQLHSTGSGSPRARAGFLPDHKENT